MVKDVCLYTIVHFFRRVESAFVGVANDSVKMTRISSVKIRGRVLILKPTRCTNFLNLFWNETLHVSDSSSVHHPEFFTVNTAMIYVIQVC